MRCDALRMPARAGSASGAKQLRKISRIFGTSSMPNQMMINGRYASGGSGR